LEIAGKSPLSHAAPLVCDFHGNYLQIMQRVLQQLTNCTYSPPTSAIQLAHSDVMMMMLMLMLMVNVCNVNV